MIAYNLKKMILIKQEQWILTLLSVNIKKEKEFRSTIGNFEEIISEEALKIGSSFKFDENQKSLMKNAIQYLDFMHSRHDFILKSDTHSLNFFDFFEKLISFLKESLNILIN